MFVDDSTYENNYTLKTIIYQKYHTNDNSITHMHEIWPNWRDATVLETIIIVHRHYQTQKAERNSRHED